MGRIQLVYRLIKTKKDFSTFLGNFALLCEPLVIKYRYNFMYATRIVLLQNLGVFFFVDKLQNLGVNYCKL